MNAKHQAHGPGRDVDARHDAEAVRAAFEGEPEVGVRAGGGEDGVSGGEDDFVAVDVVADPAVAAGEVVDSALRGTP